MTFRLLFQKIEMIFCMTTTAQQSITQSLTQTCLVDLPHTRATSAPRTPSEVTSARARALTALPAPTLLADTASARDTPSSTAKFSRQTSSASETNSRPPSGLTLTRMAGALPQPETGALPPKHRSA